jgi:hypothetical protein
MSSEIYRPRIPLGDLFHVCVCVRACVRTRACVCVCVLVYPIANPKNNADSAGERYKNA